jgi:hypothetical protein
VEEVKRDLGLPATGKLEAKLHKMLVYGPGQFFSCHQDSEASDDMVGTLVVVLPSEYRGGSMVIENQGDTVTSRRSSRGADELTVVAFYADCHHEVRPIQSGYRVSLIYRLLYGGAAPALTRAGSGQKVDELTDLLRDYFVQPVPSRAYDKEPRPPPDLFV